MRDRTQRQTIQKIQINGEKRGKRTTEKSERVRAEREKWGKEGDTVGGRDGERKKGKRGRHSRREGWREKVGSNCVW